MNFLLCVVILIFIVFILLGYKRGLFKSVFKLVLAGVALLLAYLLTPVNSSFIVDYTNIDEAIGDKVYVVIEGIAENQVKEELEGTMGDMNPDLIAELTDIALNVEPTRSQQINIIQKMKLPRFMTDALIANNNDEMREELGADGFFKYLAYYISYMATNAIAFVVTFAFMFIITSVIYFAAGIVTKLPIIGGIDRFGGVVFGALEALLIVWVIFVIVAIFVNTSFGGELYNQIDENGFLSFLYDKNILNSVVIRLTK